MDETTPPRATLMQLRTFEAVARLGGVGRAARALHIAQPTASTQLRELAAAVEATLFVPAGRGLKLTDDGRLLLEAAREMQAAWRRYQERAAEARGLLRGRLRVAAVTTAEYFVPELIGPFAHAHPGLAVELVVENRDAVVQRLEQGEDELAVMMLPPPGLPLERWPFLENPLVVVAAATHPLAQRRRAIEPHALLAHPLLAREAGSGTRLALEQFLAAQGLVWPGRMALGSNEAIKHAVAAGLGLAVLSRHALGHTPARDGLAELKVKGFPLRRMWHLVWRRDRPLGRPAAAFLEHLRERLQPPSAP